MFIFENLFALVLVASMANAAALPPAYGPPASNSSGQGDVKHYFSFGASYTQTLFNENATQPSIGNPMGNPNPGKTFTGGKNYVGFLATKYNSSSVLNYNFARGGATVSRSVVNTGPDSTTFEEQVHFRFMNKYGGSNKTWTSDDAYFSFHFGINDITIPITIDVKQQANRFKRVPDLLDHYFSYVEDLYKVGARRFMMINVPPMDRTPSIMAKNGTIRQEMKDYIIEYNSQLLNRTMGFMKTHNGSVAAYYDINAFLSKVLDDPQTYGFPNGSCIDDKGQRCIWWNDFHVGEKFDDQWSASMVHAMNALGYNGSQPIGGYFK